MNANRIIPDNFEYIIGEVYIRFTDFGVEPTKKIFGLIKISNEVFINFRINFKSS